MTGHLMYVIREGGLVCLNKNVEKKNAAAVVTY